MRREGDTIIFTEVDRIRLSAISVETPDQMTVQDALVLGDTFVSHGAAWQQEAARLKQSEYPDHQSLDRTQRMAVRYRNYACQVMYHCMDEVIYKINQK